VIDALGKSRVFDIQGPANTTVAVNLDGLTIQDGYIQGPSGSGSDAHGGGIRFVSNNSDPSVAPSTLTIKNCDIKNNTAEGGAGGGTSNAGGGFGGGIYTVNVVSNISDSTLTGNSAVGASGGFYGGVAAGGAIWAGGGGLVLTSTTVGTAADGGNSAQGGYGPLGYDPDNGGGAAFGGGIYAENCALAITSGTSPVMASVSYNVAAGGSRSPAFGGGIYSNGQSVYVDHMVVSHNQALGGSVGTRDNPVANGTAGSADGGGLDASVNAGSTFFMSYCEVESNLAKGGASFAESFARGGSGSNGGVDVIARLPDTHISTTTSEAFACGFIYNVAEGGEGFVTQEGGYAYGGDGDAGGATVAIIANSTIAGTSQGYTGDSYGGVAAGFAASGELISAHLTAGQARGGGIEGAPADLNRPSTDGPLMYKLFNSTVAWNYAVVGTPSIQETSGNFYYLGTYGAGIDGMTDGVPSIAVYSSIVANNSLLAPSPAEPLDGNDILGGTSLGYNLIQDGRGAGTTFGLANSHDQVGNGTYNPAINAGVNALDYFGGPTMTYRPSQDSTAFDRGQNDPTVNAGIVFNGHAVTLDYDQRGNPSRRSYQLAGSPVEDDYTDIGAYEYQPPVIESVAVNDGGSQRSEVISVTVLFSQPVSYSTIQTPSGPVNVLDAALTTKFYKYIGTVPGYNVILDSATNSPDSRVNPFQGPQYFVRAITFTFDPTNPTTDPNANPNPASGVLDPLTVSYVYGPQGTIF
jgi:hypothetical protein